MKTKLKIIYIITLLFNSSILSSSCKINQKRTFLTNIPITFLFYLTKLSKIIKIIG